MHRIALHSSSSSSSIGMPYTTLFQLVCECIVHTVWCMYAINENRNWNARHSLWLCGSERKLDPHFQAATVARLLTLSRIYNTWAEEQKRRNVKKGDRKAASCLLSTREFDCCCIRIFVLSFFRYLFCSVVSLFQSLHLPPFLSPPHARTQTQRRASKTYAS